MQIETLRRLILDKAMPCGAHPVGDQPGVWHWDVGAHCQDPQAVTHHARGDDRYARNEKWQVNPGSLTLHMEGLPCRKCPSCLRIRAKLWQNRARVEMSVWKRTWFCTYTLRPEEQFRALMKSLVVKNRAGWLDSDFGTADEYRLRCEEIGRLYTLYLKRVRKPTANERPVGLRYLLVFEKHRSGLPHLHALVHETSGLLSYDRLTSRWKHGHCNAKLVNSAGAASKYVSKYMTKGNEASRVRASLKYGQGGTLLTFVKHSEATSERALPGPAPAHSPNWIEIFSGEV